MSTPEIHSERARLLTELEQLARDLNYRPAKLAEMVGVLELMHKTDSPEFLVLVYTKLVARLRTEAELMRTELEDRYP